MLSAFGDDTTEPDEEIQVVETHGPNEETVDLLQRQVATEIEHNKILQEEKRRLEESVQSESAKRAKMEERLALLEQELAKKERVWKVTESELQSTISGLRERLQKNTSVHVATKSLTATAFTNIVSKNTNALKGYLRYQKLFILLLWVLHFSYEMHVSIAWTRMGEYTIVSCKKL